MPHRPTFRRKPLAATQVDSSEHQVHTIEHSLLTWHHAHRITSSEMTWLDSHIAVHPLAREDMTSRQERPKVDCHSEEQQMLLVVHIPVWDRTQNRLATAELDILITADQIISFCQSPRILEWLVEFEHRLTTDEEYKERIMGHGIGRFLYTLIDGLVDRQFIQLNKISAKLDEIDQQLFNDEASPEKLIKDIQGVRREIIAFRRVMRPQRTLIDDLEEGWKKLFSSTQENQELEQYWDDIRDALGRIWDVLENYREVVDSLHEANESIATHNINDILRVLTSMTAIILPLTLIASLFGMNVGVPGQGDKTAFWLLIIVMAALFSALFGVFKKRGWL